MRIPKRNNESGVILVTVIVLTIVLSIVAIGIMSLNVSQVKTAASVVDTVRAEQLATGLFYQEYQRRVDASPVTPPASINIGGKTYTITRSIDTTTGPNGTNQVQFNITYD